MNVIATLGRGRPVTEAEIAHYRDHGWVKLDRFVDQQTVAALLALAKGKMGDDADSNPVGGGGVDFLNNEWVSGIGEPAFAPLIASIGRNAKALMGRDVGARYLMDSFVAKLPAGKEARHDTNARTDIHQDLSTWPLDRTGGMSFWLALSDAGPDNGTMEFLSGSHRMGPLGGFITHSWGPAKTDTVIGLAPKLMLRSELSGLGVGVSASLGYGIERHRLETARVTVPLTIPLSQSVRTNFNLGWQWSGITHRHDLFLGGQAEIALSKQLNLMAEAFTLDRGKPGEQLGLRWTPGKGRVDIDLIGGHYVDGIARNAITLGLTVRR